MKTIEEMMKELEDAYKLYENTLPTFTRRDVLSLVDFSKCELGDLKVDLEEFLNEFGVFGAGFVDDYWKKFNSRVKMQKIRTWICTDTEVGIYAYFIDGVPVALSFQKARKDDKWFEFLNPEIGGIFYNFATSLIENRNTIQYVDLSDSSLDEQLPRCFRENYK